MIPVVCSYGGRSPDFMVRCTRSLAAAIPGARTSDRRGRPRSPFDATHDFVELISDTMRRESSVP